MRHWRKLCHEDHFDLYSLRYIITVIKSMRIRRMEHVARMAEKGNAYRASVGKPEGKRPLGGPRHRWQDNIKCALNEIQSGMVSVGCV
jgi:hypothetical protein